MMDNPTEPPQSTQYNNFNNGIPSGIPVIRYCFEVIAQDKSPGISRICGLLHYSIKITTTIINDDSEPPSPDTRTPPTDTAAPPIAISPLPPSPTTPADAISSQVYIIVRTTQLQQVFQVCMKACAHCESEEIKL